MVGVKAPRASQNSKGSRLRDLAASVGSSKTAQRAVPSRWQAARRSIAGSNGPNDRDNDQQFHEATAETASRHQNESGFAMQK